LPVWRCFTYVLNFAPYLRYIMTYARAKHTKIEPKCKYQSEITQNWDLHHLWLSIALETPQNTANTSGTCMNSREHEAPCVQAQITCLRHSGMPLLFYFLFWLYYIGHGLISTWAMVSIILYNILDRTISSYHFCTCFIKFSSYHLLSSIFLLFGHSI
jgi:hypothetical protein